MDTRWGGDSSDEYLFQVLTNDILEAMKLAQTLKMRGDGGRELALVLTKLEEAELWLGKVKL